MDDIGKLRLEIEQDVFDYQRLSLCLSAYSKPRDKIGRLLSAGDIVRVKKGLYVFGEAYRRRPVCRELLANLIYGPSYVSLDYALAWYGMIPERVETVTSVTTGRAREFITPFGVFAYRSLPEARYTVGVVLRQHDNVSFLMASPEKALIDKVWSDKRFTGSALADYGAYIEEDLRIDQDVLRTLDWSRLELVRKKYASRKIDRLVIHLRHLKELHNA